MFARRKTYGGFYLRSKAWSLCYDSIPTEPHIVKSAQAYVERIIGRKHCVGLADDMDLYTVARKPTAEEVANNKALRIADGSEQRQKQGVA